MAIVAYDAQATGANNGTSWTDAYQTFTAALAGAGVGGTIYVSSTSNEIHNSKFYSCDGQIVISVDNTSGIFPPPAGTYLRGASITSNLGQDISFTNSSEQGIYIHGVDFSIGDDFFIVTPNIFLDDCSTTLTGALDRLFFNSPGVHTLRDFIVIFGDTSANIVYNNGNSINWKGGSISGNVNALFNVPTSRIGLIELEGVDLSTATSLYAIAATMNMGKAIFIGCLLKSGFTTHTGIVKKGSLIALYGSHSSNIPYFIQEVHGQGSLITETVIVKTDGSSDGITPISMKFVTGASAIEFVNPLRMELPILFYTETTGVQTFDVDILTDGVTLQDDEAWLEASVPGTTIQRDISDSLPDPIAAPANLPSSAVAWTTTGISSPVKQKISLSVDVKQAGWVEAHICFAKPSEVMYADLKILDGARQFLAGQAYINGEATAVTDYPVESDVRLAVDYDSGNFTGSAAIPGASDVREAVPVDATVGTYEPADEADVLLDVQYGAGGTELTGELSPTIKGPIKLLKLDTGIKVIKI